MNTTFNMVMMQAAIDLKVPMSNIPELDTMIRESRRLDIATAAMHTTIQMNEHNINEYQAKMVAEYAMLAADALLAASGEEQMK